MEDKQSICTVLCAVLQMTDNAGSGNYLKELRYLPEGNGFYSEVVRPIFKDDTGEDGYYDVNVSMDSGTAMIIDIVNQFVSKVW
jgi:hypothetical protein